MRLHVIVQKKKQKAWPEAQACTSPTAHAYAAVAGGKKIATTADGSCACTAAASIERMFKGINQKKIKAGHILRRPEDQIKKK